MSRPPDEKEAELLKKFKVTMKGTLSEQRLRNDSYLLRWIRARNHDLVKAEEMLRNSLEWRKKYRVEELALDAIPDYFSNFLNCTCGGIDKEGRPGVPFGEWDLRQTLDEGRKDDLYNFLIQVLEIMDNTMQEMWNHNFPFKSLWPHTQFTVIFDLKGFTYSKLMHKKSIDSCLDCIRMYEANYPETLGKAIVINAPRIFSMMYSMIKPLLSEHTVSKISIYDSKESEWKKAILEVIEADQIPARYGGISTNPI